MSGSWTPHLFIDFRKYLLTRSSLGRRQYVVQVLHQNQYISLRRTWSRRAQCKSCIQVEHPRILNVIPRRSWSRRAQYKLRMGSPGHGGGGSNALSSMILVASSQNCFRSSVGIMPLVASSQNGVRSSVGIMPLVVSSQNGVRSSVGIMPLIVSSQNGVKPP
jgi:hypothetical protein